MDAVSCEQCLGSKFTVRAGGGWRNNVQCFCPGRRVLSTVGNSDGKHENVSEGARRPGWWILSLIVWVFERRLQLLSSTTFGRRRCVCVCVRCISNDKFYSVVVAGVCVCAVRRGHGAQGRLSCKLVSIDWFVKKRCECFLLTGEVGVCVPVLLYIGGVDSRVFAGGACLMFVLGGRVWWRW